MYNIATVVESDCIVVKYPKPSANHNSMRAFIAPVAVVGAVVAVVGAVSDYFKNKQMHEWEVSVGASLDDIDKKIALIIDELHNMGVMIAQAVIDSENMIYRREIRARGLLLTNWVNNGAGVNFPVSIKNPSAEGGIIVKNYEILRDALLQLADSKEPSYASYAAVIVGYSYFLLCTRMTELANFELPIVKKVVLQYLQNAVGKSEINTIGSALQARTSALTATVYELERRTNRWLVVNWSEPSFRDDVGGPGRGGLGIGVDIVGEVGNKENMSVVNPMSVDDRHAIPYRWVYVSGSYLGAPQISYSVGPYKGVEPFPGLPKGRFDNGSGDMSPAEQAVSGAINSLFAAALNESAQIVALQAHMDAINLAIKEFS